MGTNFNFLETIGKVERELETSFGKRSLGACMRWADEKFNNAWTNEIDNFAIAIDKFSVDSDENSLRKAIFLYQTKLLELIAIYKKENPDTNGDIENILRSLDCPV